MNQFKVGVLGGSGEIAKKLCYHLNKNKIKYSISSRRKEDKTRYGLSISYFDIEDESALEKFILKNDIIVNCIGPTFVYGRFILNKVAKSKKIYIDPFGDKFILDEDVSYDSPIIISSGDCPGFAGVLCHWIKNEFFDKINTITICYRAGGSISKSGLFDLLMSSNMRFGLLNCYYKNGLYEKSIKSEAKRFSFLLNKENYEYEYITNEMFDVANYLDVDEIHFNNMYASKEEYNGLKKIYLEIVNCSCDFKKVKTSKEFSNNLKLLNQNSDESTFYYIEGAGYKDGMSFIVNTELLCDASSSISSYVLYKCIEQLMYLKIEKGIYRPFHILNSKEMIMDMLNAGIIKKIYNNNNSYETGSI